MATASHPLFSAAVTSETPLPLDTGGHPRTTILLRMLATRFDVRLVAPVGPGGDTDAARADRVGGSRPGWCPVAPAHDRQSKRLKARRGRRLCQEPLRCSFRRHFHRAVARAIRRGKCSPAPRRALPRSSRFARSRLAAARGVPVVVDMHNVYSRLARRAAMEASGVVRPRLRGARGRPDCSATGNSVVRVAAHYSRRCPRRRPNISRALGASRVVVVPNGVDCAAYAELPRAHGSRRPFCTLGRSSGHRTPPSAASFLVSDVLPIVHESLPDARAIIVGKNPPAEKPASRQSAGRCAPADIAGRVPDVTGYSTSHLLAVPLESGGGTRLKILEAFAAGLPVVSTRSVREALAARDGEHLAVANRGAFASAIVDLLRHPERAAAMAVRARAVALHQYRLDGRGLMAGDAVATAASQPRPRAASQAGLAILKRVRRHDDRSIGFSSSGV